MFDTVLGYAMIALQPGTLVVCSVGEARGGLWAAILDPSGIGVGLVNAGLARRRIVSCWLRLGRCSQHRHRQKDVQDTLACHLREVGCGP